MGVFQLTTTSIPKWGKGKRQKNGYDENKKTPRQKKEYTLSGEDKTQKRNRDSYKKNCATTATHVRGSCRTIFPHE